MNRYCYLILLTGYPTIQKLYVEANSLVEATQKIRFIRKDIRKHPYFICTLADDEHIKTAEGRLWDQWKSLTREVVTHA